MDFHNSLPFERSVCFDVTITENFERFQYFNFATNFLKNETTKIASASFLYKTVMSEANVKTNRMGSTKWTYQKDRTFASNYFIFLEDFISV